MAYVITGRCVDVKDQACVDVCPVDCIHGEDEDRTLYIAPLECIDCGACEPVCPAEAIFDEASLAPEDAPWKALNALWYEDRAAARDAVEEAMRAAPRRA